MQEALLLSRSVDLARAAAVGAAVLPDALELLDRYVGADTLSLSAMRLREGADPQADVTVRGADPMTAWELDLWPGLMATHPYLPTLVAGPMTASRVTDVVDFESFERSDLYQLLLRPRGSRYQAGLLLDRSPESMLLLSLWRQDRDFSAAEMTALEAFRSVLAAAVAFAKAIEAAQAAAGELVGSRVAGSALLTTRQREVAGLLEAGLSNDQIARRLGISSRTVRKHVEDLFDRTGARSRTQVALWWRHQSHP